MTKELYDNLKSLEGVKDELKLQIHLLDAETRQEFENMNAESGEETSLKEEAPSTTLEEKDGKPDPVSENTESREQEKLKASGD